MGAPGGTRGALMKKDSTDKTGWKLWYSLSPFRRTCAGNTVRPCVHPRAGEGVGCPLASLPPRALLSATAAPQGQIAQENSMLKNACRWRHAFYAARWRRAARRRCGQGRALGLVSVAVVAPGIRDGARRKKRERSCERGEDRGRDGETKSEEDGGGKPRGEGAGGCGVQRI